MTPTKTLNLILALYNLQNVLIIHLMLLMANVSFHKTTLFRSALTINCTLKIQNERGCLVESLNYLFF